MYKIPLTYSEYQRFFVSCVPSPLGPATAGILTTQHENVLAAHLNNMPSTATEQCLSYVDVYVGNFILLQQGLPLQ